MLLFVAVVVKEVESGSRFGGLTLLFYKDPYKIDSIT